MTVSHALAFANALILVALLTAAVVLSGRVSLVDARGHVFPYAAGLLSMAPVCAVAGTAWSGWLALRELRPRGFWSRTLFTLGVVLCLAEVVVALYLPIGAV